MGMGIHSSKGRFNYSEFGWISDLFLHAYARDSVHNNDIRLMQRFSGTAAALFPVHLVHHR